MSRPAAVAASTRRPAGRSPAAARAAGSAAHVSDERASAAASAAEAPEPLTLALAVEDAALADRLAALLAPLEGVRLVPAHEPAEAIITASAPRGPGGGGPPGLDLTRREAEVLAILAEGASNREIAARLGISPHTAKFHVRSLYDKLDATGRVDAVAHAARIGAIQL